MVDNDGGPHPEREVSATLFLRAGSYPLRLEWFNQRRHAVVQLLWRSADLDIPKQVVPSAQLRPADPAAPTPLAYADGLNMSAYWSGVMPSGFPADYAALAPHLRIQKLAPRVRRRRRLADGGTGGSGGVQTEDVWGWAARRRSVHGVQV